MKLLGLYLLKFELCCLLLQGRVTADNGESVPDVSLALSVNWRWV